MFVGIDTHKHTLAVAIVDDVGRPLDAFEAANTPAGITDLVDRLAGLEVARVGIEGSGNFGRPATRALTAAGMTVVEVPPQLTANGRRGQRTWAKTDEIDAVVIARITLRDADLPATRDDNREDLRVLIGYRSELIAERTQAVNRIHRDLHQILGGAVSTARRLSTGASIAKVRGLLRGHTDVRVEIVRARLRRIVALNRDITALGKRIATHPLVANHPLQQLAGCGPITCAELVAHTGNARRFPTRNHYAMANGTAPIPASSGETTRHRLNRGGNRQLNKALHTIALNQIRHRAAGATYYDRKRAEGKTRREALRCLKRRLSDRVYTTLTSTTCT